ncbi:hypothetical protein DPEC_G00324250 [Dallia pectoralis]|uniref:Uncharacterized protein n=1 Tax=Dallia pectoralis TaxID=75939 RepID=A0ACC2FB62_DALPE|nr:hypothetical protein DPEC_G00324250 [Dallia pectoralis]
MTAFIAHPSVRIRGTEHNYNPVLCQDDNCSGVDKGTHMHCPFCTVVEAYPDPVILRAHYYIKHVDKGIDFAGLKVLRCCNHCEIVGTIKGEKRFKGAHWHCYRCRNGFNRRDEAIKHYKTHFRNPHTTFQIQVTQEVNSRQRGSCGGIMAHPVLNTANTENLLTVEPKDSSVNDGILVAAEEEVGSSQYNLDRSPALVLMDPDGQGGNLIYEEADSIISEQGREGLEHTLQVEKQLLELHQQNLALQHEKDAMEKRLKAEIQRLNEKVATVVQSNIRLFDELMLYRPAENSQQRIDQLMKSLEEQHRSLIHTQLASLRTELWQAEKAVLINGHTEHTVSLTGEEAASLGDMTLLEEEQTEKRVEGEGEALTVVVQMGPDPDDLVPISADECLATRREEESSVLDIIDSGAETLKNATKSCEDKEIVEQSSSKKRCPEKEPWLEGKAKQQRIC